MPLELKEINEKVDEVSKLVSAFQDQHKDAEKRGLETSEGLEKIKEEFAKQSTEWQELADQWKAEEKARKDMELAIARLAATGGGGANGLSNSDYLKDFSHYLFERKKVTAENQDAEFLQGLKYYGLENVSESKKVVLKTLMTGSNPSGGYMVPIEMLTDIVKRVFETSKMREIATVRNTAREAVEIFIDDGLFTSVKKAELDTAEDTDTSERASVIIPVHKQQAMPDVSQDHLDDAAYNVEEYVTNKLVQKFALVENTEFVNGQGNKQAEGFMTLASWAAPKVYERNALGDIVTSTVSTVVGDDLIDIQASLLEDYQRNAVWTMHRLIWAEILKFKDDNGQYLLNPAMLFTGSLGMQLLGQPVKLFADMPDSFVDDGYALAYGDFREGYTIIDRIGMRMIRDEITDKGFVKYYTTKRTGGAVTNFQAIKRLKIQAAG